MIGKNVAYGMDFVFSLGDIYVLFDLILPFLFLPLLAP